MRTLIALCLLPCGGWAQPLYQQAPGVFTNRPTCYTTYPVNTHHMVSGIPNVSNNPDTGEVRLSLKYYTCKKEYGAMVCTPKKERK